jgi:hypothetical protein
MGFSSSFLEPFLNNPSIKQRKASEKYIQSLIWDSFLKGHGNEVDFLGFCINRFGIGPVHYVSSCSDFGCDFAEIFIIKK